MRQVLKEQFDSISIISTRTERIISLQDRSPNAGKKNNQETKKFLKPDALYLHSFARSKLLPPFYCNAC